MRLTRWSSKDQCRARGGVGPSPTTLEWFRAGSAGWGSKMFLKTMAAAALTAAVALAGCASVGAPETEGQLAAAGFMRLQADTPEKLAKLQALPQNTIIYAQRKKGNAYIYADAAGCNCAFIGNA